MQIIDRFSGASSTTTTTRLLPAISENARYVAALDSASGGRRVVFAHPLKP